MRGIDMKLEGLDVVVSVNLDNGIYQFCCESSTGKTRLYNTVKKYQRAGYNAAAYSYTDFQDGLNFEDVINKVQPSLLVIDRYDMFSDKYQEDILKVAKDCIVLIDSKDVLTFNDYYTTCTIDMTPVTIEVER